MNIIQEEQLKVEIAHIFESGANEIRVLEMVKSFINKYNTSHHSEIDVILKSITEIPSTDEEKNKHLSGFIQTTSKYILAMFRACGLKTHIECAIVDDKEKQNYIFRFQTEERFNSNSN